MNDYILMPEGACWIEHRPLQKWTLSKEKEEQLRRIEAEEIKRLLARYPARLDEA